MPRPNHLALLLVLLAGPAAAQWEFGAERKPFAPEGARFHHPRTRTYDLLHLRLDIRVDLERRIVAGRATLTLAPIVPALREVALDGVDLAVSAARVDGKPVEYANDGRRIAVLLPRVAPVGAPISLELDYRARPREGMFFVERIAPDGSLVRMVHTQGETVSHRHWFPCYDAPNDLTTTEIVATVDGAYEVVSNGVLVVEGEGDRPPLDADGATRTWRWRQDRPHAVYLVTLVIGSFDVRRDAAGGVPLLYYVPAGRGAQVEPTFRRTPAMLSFFERTIGVRYAWPKYAQVCPLGFDGGGMENTGATTLRPSTLHDERNDVEYSSDALVSHELVHQWFGDLVTCRDWAEIWLNEGFATYFETLWLAEVEGPARQAWELEDNRGWYLSEDAHDYRRPLVTRRYASPDDLFDGHTYAKGAWVLHMLRHQVGDEDFFGGLKGYLEENAHRPVGTPDLRRAVEKAAGADLGWFFEQWVERPGHPEFSVRHAHRPEEGTLVLFVEQVQRTDAGTPVFRARVDVAILAGDEWSTHQVEIDSVRHEFALPCPTPPDLVLFDPGHHLLSIVDLPRSTGELVVQLERDPHPVGRKEAAEGLARRLGEGPAVIDALEGALRRDPAPLLRAHVAREVGRALHGQRWESWSGRWEREDPAVPDPDRSLAARAVALLAAAYEDADPRVRTAAIRALVGFRGVAGAEELARRAAADERSDGTRAAGVRVAGRLGGAGAEALLLAAAEVQSHRELVRQAALEGLADLGSLEAFALAARFVRAVHDEDLRRTALAVLERAGAEDPQILDHLFELLNDVDDGIVSAAIETLGRVGRIDPVRSARHLLALTGPGVAPDRAKAVQAAIQAIRQPPPAEETAPEEGSSTGG